MQIDYSLVHEIATLWSEGKEDEAIEKLDDHQDACYPLQLFLLELRNINYNKRKVKTFSNSKWLKDMLIIFTKKPICTHKEILERYEKIVEQNIHPPLTEDGKNRLFHDICRECTTCYAYYKDDRLDYGNIYYTLNDTGKKVLFGAFEITENIEK